MFSEQKNSIRVTAATRKNGCPDKPYEDAYWAGLTSRTFCVADGITRSRMADGSYPNPSPASDVANMVVSTVESAVCHHDRASSMQRAVFEGLRGANRRISDYVETQAKNNKSFTDDIPGAVATVLAIEDQYATFVHVGDCVAILLPQGDLSRASRLTIDQTSGARNWLKTASPMSHASRMGVIRNSIRNVANHPLAFGVFCGDPNVFRFVQTGRIRATKGDTFLLCTDGLQSVLSRLPEDQSLQQLVTKRDVENILDYADELDRKLQLRSDDKTLLIIDLIA